MNSNNVITILVDNTIENLINNITSLDKDVSFEEEKLNAKAQYQLINCVNDDNQEFVTKKTTIKEI